MPEDTMNAISIYWSKTYGVRPQGNKRGLTPVWASYIAVFNRG